MPPALLSPADFLKDNVKFLLLIHTLKQGTATQNEVKLTKKSELTTDTSSKEKNKVKSGLILSQNPI